MYERDIEVLVALCQLLFRPWSSSTTREQVAMSLSYSSSSSSSSLSPAMIPAPDATESRYRARRGASGRKGRERERRPVFHTWLCYVETERHIERRTDGHKPGESPPRGHGGGDVGFLVFRSGRRACSRHSCSVSQHVLVVSDLLSAVRRGVAASAPQPHVRITIHSACYRPGVRVTARIAGLGRDAMSVLLLLLLPRDRMLTLKPTSFE